MLHSFRSLRKFVRILIISSLLARLKFYRKSVLMWNTLAPLLQLDSRVRDLSTRSCPFDSWFIIVNTNNRNNDLMRELREKITQRNQKQQREIDRRSNGPKEV